MLAFYRLPQGEGSGAIGKAVHVDILAMHQEAEVLEQAVVFLLGLQPGGQTTKDVGGILPAKTAVAAIDIFVQVEAGGLPYLLIFYVKEREGGWCRLLAAVASLIPLPDVDHQQDGEVVAPGGVDIPLVVMKSLYYPVS